MAEWMEWMNEWMESMDGTIGHFACEHFHMHYAKRAPLELCNLLFPFGDHKSGIVNAWFVNAHTHMRIGTNTLAFAVIL